MNIDEVLHGIIIFLIKLVILLQYLHLLAPSKSVNRFVFFGAWSLIIINTTYYVINIPIELLYCSPRAKIWNKFIENGHCMNQDAVVASTSVFNIILDLAILVLPIRSVWKLRISLQKKLKLIALFATGIL
jgi:sorbitol-specific phosphotransferase system component IIC